MCDVLRSFCPIKTLIRSVNVRVLMCALPDVEVLHVDVLVGSGLPLAPQEKTLLRRGLCSEEEEEEQRRREERR